MSLSERILKFNKNRSVLWLSAAVIYCLLFFILSYPLILRFNSAYFGSSGGYKDLPLDIWLHWFMYDSFSHGRDFFSTDLTIFPIGFSLIDNVSGFFLPALSGFLQFFVNLSAAYNLSVVFCVVMTALCGFLLGWSITEDKWAGIVSGFIFAFNPYCWNEILFGRMVAAMGAGMALFLFFVFRYLRSPARVYIAGMAVSFIFCCLTSLYYGYFVILMSFLIAAVYGRKPGFLRGLISALFIGMAAIALLYREHLIIIGTISYVEDSVLFKAGGPVYIGLQQIDNALSLNSFFSRTFVFVEILKRPSLVILALSACCFIGSKKDLKLWLSSVAVFTVLCLGPFLKWSGKMVMAGGYPVPLPGFIMFKWFPLYARIHWPDRFMIIVMLALSVLAGWGFVSLCRKFKAAEWAKVLLAVAFIASITAESAFVPLTYMFPAPLTGYNIPQVYRDMGMDKEDYAIIQIPIGDPEYLVSQTVHRKKTLSGQSSLLNRYPMEYVRYVQDNGFLSDLFELSRKPGYKAGPAREEDISRLREDGFRAIVMDTSSSALSPRVRSYILDNFQILREYSDGNIVLDLRLLK